MDFGISREILTSIIAAVVTAIAAVVSQLLAKRKNASVDEFQSRIKDISRLVDAQTATARANVAERVAERLPTGLTENQFTELVTQITARLPSPAEPATVAAVENLITGYHEQALSQAKAQFWFSVFAASIGFAWILYSGADIRPDNLATVSRILPGTVMDAVAFLFFKQASETRQRATELYDRLRRDQQMSESILLVSSIEDDRVRSVVKAQIALHLSGLQPSPIELGTFLSPVRSVDPR